MPIRSFLTGRTFDPETIQIMSDAFTSVCGGLGLTDRDDPATRLVAERIIAHAERGVTSRNDLYALVISESSKTASNTRPTGTREHPSFLFGYYDGQNTTPMRVEDQPWYPQWRNALERVIAASMAVDATMVGTPERLAAKHEHEAALAEFRKVANEIR